jgi:opacity protein-like surface antigen
MAIFGSFAISQSDQFMKAFEWINEISSRKRTHPKHVIGLGLVIMLAGLMATGSSLDAAEIDLKSLKSIASEKKKYGPYVGVSVGSTQSQDVSVILSGRDYLVSEQVGGFFIAVDIGHSWKAKKFPLELGLEFESSFLTGEISGELDPDAPIAAIGSTVNTFSTNVFAANFMANGWVGLDLWRYRARIGKFLAGWRPYLGGGIGGAQIWFRDTVTTTLDGVSLPTIDPFAIDEFVFVTQFFGGIEYRLNDRLAAFAEYRKVNYDEGTDFSDLDYTIWSAGLHVRY